MVIGVKSIKFKFSLSVKKSSRNLTVDFIESGEVRL